MRQSFATDTGGSQLQEFATPQAARMASNQYQRGQFLAAPPKPNLTEPPGWREQQANLRYGTPPYVPGSVLAAQKGAAGIEIAGTRSPEKAAMAEGERERQRQQAAQRVGGEFDKFLAEESEFSTLEKGQLKFTPQNTDMARDASAAKAYAMSQGDAKAGVQHFRERQLLRQWFQSQSLPMGFNVNASLNAAASNPEVWQGLVAEARAAARTTRPRRSMLDYMNMGAEAQRPGENMVP